MALEITIKDPRNSEQTINACFRLRSIQLDVDNGGELRFDVWRSKEIRERVKNDPNDTTKPLSQMYVVTVGSNYFVLPDTDTLASIKLSDLLDKDKNINMDKIYRKIKQHMIAYNGEIIDLKTAKDI